jgi:hypothetical protein
MHDELVQSLRSQFRQASKGLKINSKNRKSLFFSQRGPKICDESGVGNVISRKDTQGEHRQIEDLSHVADNSRPISVCGLMRTKVVILEWREDYFYGP